MLGGADNTNGELPSYITGADTKSSFLMGAYERSFCLVFMSKSRIFARFEFSGTESI